jgi:hypothetical protein
MDTSMDECGNDMFLLQVHETSLKFFETTKWQSHLQRSAGLQKTCTSTHSQNYSQNHPVVMTNIAMENGPFIDGFPS